MQQLISLAKIIFLIVEILVASNLGYPYKPIHLLLEINQVDSVIQRNSCFKQVCRNVILNIRQYLPRRKKVRILYFSGPYFLLFKLNTDIYFINLYIQSEYGKCETGKHRIPTCFTQCVIIWMNSCLAKTNFRSVGF